MIPERRKKKIRIPNFKKENPKNDIQDDEENISDDESSYKIKI